MEREKTRMNLSSFDGTALNLQIDKVKNSDGAIIIVHGLGEHLGRYDHLSQKLNRNHYDVYRYDQRGHGNSGGKRCHLREYYDLILDLYEVLSVVKKDSVNKNVAILGQSLGGLVALLFAAMYPQEKLFYIISGAPSPMGKLNYLIPNGPDEKYFTDPHLDLICSLPEVVEQWKKDPLTQNSYTLGLFRNVAKGMEFLKKNIHSIQSPLLFLHGAEDRIVPPDNAWNNFSSVASKEKSLRIYESRFHEIYHDIDQEEVIDDVLTWLKGKMK